MDPEEAHYFAQRLLPLLSILKPQCAGWQISPRLATTIAGTRIANPIGLAAGFDKNATHTEWLSLMGFGFAEIGSVTAQPRPGNPKPRIFRLIEDEAVINYLGLNGDGAEVVAARMRTAQPSLPLALSIAKTNDPTVVGDKAAKDFVTTFSAMKDIPMLFASINVSCPNTHETKLQELDMLDAVFQELTKVNSNHIPLFVKLSPDSDRELLENVVSLVSRHRLSGYVVGNTSTDRSMLKTTKDTLTKIGPGGLSGPPIRAKVVAMIRQLYALKQKDQQIIACGGITSGADAFQVIAAGADALELYTGLVYHGPYLPFTIAQELAEILEQKGMNLTEAIGSAVGVVAATV